MQAKGLPIAFYQRKLDSINLKLNHQLSLQPVSGKINGQVSALKSKLTAPHYRAQKELNKKELAVRKKIRKKKSSLDSLITKANDQTSQIGLPGSKAINPTLLNQNLPNVNLPNNSVDAPGLTLSNEGKELNKLNKDLTLTQSQEVRQLESELKQIEMLPKKQLNATGIAREANEIKKDTKEVSTLEKKADGYKKDLKDIKHGDKEKINKLEKDAEQQAEKTATNASEIKDLKKEEKIVQTQKNALQQYQDMLSNIDKEKGLKEAGKISSKELKNPFVGQEAKLQAGIAQLDKLKKKYHTIPDSRYLPKRAPNEMKGKPLKERIVPGLGFQWYQGKQIGVDLSPYFMYRLRGGLRIGVGVSDRFVIDNKKWDVSSGHVLAIRAMTDFRLINTLNLHAEEEWTHYGDGAQNIFRTPSDPPLKEWNMRLNAGVLKTYKISRRLDGQMQLLYNTMDWSNFPQSKNTTVRFGIEFKLGMKKVAAQVSE
jgi:hypothetical protein